MLRVFTKVRNFIEYVRCLNKRKISKATANILYNLLLHASKDERGIYTVSVDPESPAGVYKLVRPKGKLDILEYLLSLQISVHETEETYIWCHVFSEIAWNNSEIVHFEFSKAFTDAFNCFYE